MTVGKFHTGASCPGLAPGARVWHLLVVGLGGEHDSLSRVLAALSPAEPAQQLFFPPGHWQGHGCGPHRVGPSRGQPLVQVGCGQRQACRGPRPGGARALLYTRFLLHVGVWVTLRIQKLPKQSMESVYTREFL